jgi:hypothetical protein
MFTQVQIYVKSYNFLNQKFLKIISETPSKVFNLSSMFRKNKKLQGCFETITLNLIGVGTKNLCAVKKNSYWLLLFQFIQKYSLKF